MPLVVKPEDLTCVQLVYGHAGWLGNLCIQMKAQLPFYLLPPFSICPSSLRNPGDGKTHYIKQQLAYSPAGVTVSVNEAFTPLKAISKLRKLPVKQKNCAIFFNFTMMPPGVRKGELQTYTFSCYDADIAL